MGYKLEEYIVKDNKKMRYGYTTGTCAAAAANAAVRGLITGECPPQVDITTPKGFVLSLPIEHICFDGEAVSCAVKKDAGDDPDITDGVLIYAQAAKHKEDTILIDGGKGVGRVTKPGLDQPVGQAAINRVPRRMIEAAVMEVCDTYHYDGGISVIISIPDGEALALKTFNPSLGIVGGISVLGTSGIVEPMSEDSLIETIKVEMNVQKALGNDCLLVVPGNYGEDFLRAQLQINQFPIVKCSNYVGDTVDYAHESGLKGLLFVAHIGKFIKIAGGSMNTHSKYGDGRMDALISCAREHGLLKELEAQLHECVMMDEAIRLLEEAGMKEAVLKTVMTRIKLYLRERCHGEVLMEAIVFSNKYGELGRTDGASALLEKFRDGGDTDEN